MQMGCTYQWARAFTHFTQLGRRRGIRSFFYRLLWQMDGYINPKIEQMWKFLRLPSTSNLQKKKTSIPSFFLLLSLLFCLFPTTRNPAAPTTNASCNKMDDLMMTLCVCVCVCMCECGKGQDTLFCLFFPSQSKANHRAGYQTLCVYVWVWTRTRYSIQHSKLFVIWTHLGLLGIFLWSVEGALCSPWHANLPSFWILRSFCDLYLEG